MSKNTPNLLNCVLFVSLITDRGTFTRDNNNNYNNNSYGNDNRNMGVGCIVDYE